MSLVPAESLVRRGTERDRIRNARPRKIRPTTVAVRGVSRTALAVGRALFPERPGVDYERPRTRGDCERGLRPCPYVSCSMHLYLNVNPKNGSIRFNFPDVDVTDMEETCTLDLAARGGMTLDRVRHFVNATREGVRQIELSALAKVVDLFATALGVR